LFHEEGKLQLMQDVVIEMREPMLVVNFERER
jgi:hypothetical protein